MENEKNLSRKKFLSWGIALSSMLTLPSIVWGRKPKPATKGKMVKMLTPDGKLVEVDENILAAATKKAKAGNAEIFQWMKNPSKKG